MTKVFVKQSELKLVNGGYTVVGENNTPVSNKEFIDAQKVAEYIVTLASRAKGVCFTDSKGVDVEQFKYDILSELKSKKEVEYLNTPIAPVAKIGDKLKKEALDFIDYGKDVDKTNRINRYLSNFNIINEFEEFGLFFDQEIVKLNKIYSMEEIIAATTEVIDIL